MHRSLVAPWARVVAGRERILARVGGVPLEVRERRPGPTSWSVLDVVEHLTLVEGAAGTALAKAPTPDRPRAFPAGHWWRYPALRAVLLLGIRIRAPVDLILPRRDTPWEGLVTRWRQGHERLAEWLEGVAPALLRDPRFRHPIAGWLTIREGLVFMGDHQVHHEAQIERVGRVTAGK